MTVLRRRIVVVNGALGPHNVTHLLQQNAILCLNGFDPVLDQSILLGLGAEVTSSARGLVVNRRFHVPQLLLVKLLTSTDVPLHAGLVLDRNGLSSSVHGGFVCQAGRSRVSLGWEETEGGDTEGE